MRFIFHHLFKAGQPLKLLTYIYFRRTLSRMLQTKLHACREQYSFFFSFQKYFYTHSIMKDFVPVICLLIIVVPLTLKYIRMPYFFSIVQKIICALKYKETFFFKINISNGVISDPCHTLLTSINFVVLFKIIKKNVTDFLRLHTTDIDVIFIDNLLDHSIQDADVA